MSLPTVPRTNLTTCLFLSLFVLHTGHFSCFISGYEVNAPSWAAKRKTVKRKSRDLETPLYIGVKNGFWLHRFADLVCAICINYVLNLGYFYSLFANLEYIELNFMLQRANFIPDKV